MPTYNRNRNRSRRQGQVIVYVALMMPVLLGIAAFVVDLDSLYLQRAHLQAAADSAALAGAFCLAYPSNSTCANTTPTGYAETLSADNGYDPIGNPTRVTFADNTGGSTTSTASVTDPVTGNTETSWYQVTLTDRVNNIFAGALGIASSTVAATATAQYSGPKGVPIPGNEYGLTVASGANYTYEYFGPYGLYSNGDFTATKYYDINPNPSNPLPSGFPYGAVNVDYQPTGVNFDLTVDPAATYANDINGSGKANGTTQVQVQIFDAGTTTTSSIDDVNGRAVGKTDSNYNGENIDTTQYTLYYDVDGNPDNPSASDHVQVAQFTADPSNSTDADIENSWYTPPGFQFDLANYTGGEFHINVQTSQGYTGNGFGFRAGPPNTDTAPSQDVSWQNTYGDGSTGNDYNGTSIGADTVMPINIPNNGGTETIDIPLTGELDPGSATSGAANNGVITVTKFDTDIGAEGLSYVMTTSPNAGEGTVLATYSSSYTFDGSHIALDKGNGAFSTDTIALPTSFTGPGYLHAEYTAGAGDNSQWQVSYAGSGASGQIFLVE